MRFRWYKIIWIWKILDSIFWKWKKIRFCLKFWNFCFNSSPKIGLFSRKKRFPDLAENWLIWGSDDIKLFKFGKFWIPFFQNGKKSNFVPKIGGFGRQKRFSDLAENWLIWGSDDIKLFKFGTFWISFFPIGKKSDLLSNFEILSQIPYGEQRFFFGLYKSYWNSTPASLARTVLKLCALNNKKCGSRMCT